MFKIPNSIRYSSLVLVSVALSSCNKPAPIGVHFRQSYLDRAGQVLVVQNNSSRHLSCLMTVRNKTHSTRTSYSFAVGPGDSASIGILETGWSFQSGEQVAIAVEGYAKRKLNVP